MCTTAVVVAAGCSKQLPTQSKSIGLSVHTNGTAAVGACTGVIGDFVWNDLNANGIQDAGEPGLSGATVVLVEEDGDYITQQTTGSSGAYLFTNLCPGTYKVLVKPTDCQPTIVRAGKDRAKDSDEIPVTVVLTGSDRTIDFGYACPGGNPPCKPCKGKVTTLTLRYTGTVANAHVVVKQKKNLVNFDGNVQPGQEFTFSGRDNHGTFEGEIKVYVGNGSKENAKFKTDCSKPVGPGLRVGDFEIVSGLSREGGTLCPITGGGDNPCAGRAKPKGLTFTYTGNDCSATHHSQADGKVICTQLGSMPATAHIVITDGDTEGTGSVYFDGFVSIGGSLTMDAANAGRTRLATNSWAYVYDGSTLVQKVQFHTSCSQPLINGDEYGSLELTGFIPASAVFDAGVER